ncbi:hypothetical protein Tco_1069907 [Tanacetum coccineum]|uniref:Reverse transcriptase domain-containing protein n=1 Tax=Tanacetum coccineum TaxID=301880 RepID=A0ABQ5HJX6_9ASTR
MLKRCEDTNLALNWEKSHFMVKEGIALGHKISKSGIKGTDISQKDEKPSKKQQNQSRDGKVCEGEAQSKSSQLREEKA